MKVKTRVVLGAAAMAATIVGIAYATPIVGLASPFFSVGQDSADIRTHGVGRTASGQGFEVELRTEGPATMTNQHNAFAAGGHVAWHSSSGHRHRHHYLLGPSSGSTRTGARKPDCKAGDSWTEGSKLHYFTAW